MIKCIKCLSVSVYIYIYMYIYMHLSDRKLLLETELAVLCATMHLQPCGTMRLACHAFFCFLFPQINPTSYAFPQVGQEVGQETAPLVVSGCCHASFSIYLLVTYLSAILHTCISGTSCSPRRTITAHKISVSVHVRRILFTSLRTCKHRSWWWIWGCQGRRSVGSRRRGGVVPCSVKTLGLE